MATFEYDILVGKNAPDAASGVIWFLASDMRSALGDNLPAILNVLGSKGWEVAAIGDLGFDARAEIVLRREA